MRVASVLVLVSIAPLASAEEPVALRWSLRGDDTFYVVTRVTQTHAGEVNGETSETTLDFDLTLRYRVLKATAGATAVEVTHLAASVRAEGATGLDGIGERVRGRSVTIRLDDNRTPTALRGGDEILKQFRDATAIERDTAGVLFGAGGARELLGRPFEILPAKAMRVGDTSTRDDTGTVGGLTSTGKSISKLESVADGVAKVTVKSELIIKAGGPAANAKIDLRSERAEGQYTFDTRTGRLKEFAHETVLGGTITTAAGDKEDVVKVTTRRKQTVTVSDKNPVRD